MGFATCGVFYVRVAVREFDDRCCYSSTGDTGHEVRFIFWVVLFCCILDAPLGHWARCFFFVAFSTPSRGVLRQLFMSSVS
jgi:hypothetical protein